MTCYDDADKMVKGWRGRRLLACRMLDIVDDIIENLDTHPPDEDPAPSGGFPHPPTAMQKQEMKNQVTSLLRSILLWNDGHVSQQELRRW